MFGYERDYQRASINRQEFKSYFFRKRLIGTVRAFFWRAYVILLLFLLPHFFIIIYIKLLMFSYLCESRSCNSHNFCRASALTNKKCFHSLRYRHRIAVCTYQINAARNTEKPLRRNIEIVVEGSPRALRFPAIF